MLRTDYRFTLTRDTDTFEVTPSGFFDGSFKDEQSEGQLFFRRKLDADLSFSGSDYAYIKYRYDLGNYCDIYELLIEKKVSGVYQIDWMGFFSMTDGKFDFERCRFTTNVTLQDKYTCILNNWETEVNILDINLVKTGIKANVISSLEFQYLASNTLLQSMSLFRDYSGCDEGVVKDYTQPTYAREAILLPKYITLSGSGWLLWDGNDDPLVGDYSIPGLFNMLTPNDSQNKWVRDFSYNYVASDNVNFIAIQSQSGWTLQQVLDACFTGNASDYVKMVSLQTSPNIFPSQVMDYYRLPTLYINKITNIEISYIAISLINLIPSVLFNICQETYTLISDFLTNATNPVTGIASKTNNLYIIQKSDAKRPNASNPATKGNITFRQLMESLYNMFQLWWYINDSNQIVIVHQSEIENNLGLDITIDPYIKTTAHKKIFQFDKTLLYRYETWKFAESNGIDFVGQSIEYSELCTVKESVNKTKNYDISIITTDLEYVQTNSDDISDDGFVIIATDGANVLTENGAITGILQLNGHLATSNLQDKYWRHNRILSIGKLNGVDVTFISTQKIKKLTEQTIILCEDYDPLKQVTTELGPANVKESSFFPLDKRLVLNMSI
jgi:hypothetical protein